MRDAYHEELHSVGLDLVEMARLAAAALGKATAALLDAELEPAEAVIAADDEIDALQHGLEQKAVRLLVRQQPVATDLRVIVSALRMSADLERAGDLARHVAELARLRFPESMVPADLRPTVREMGSVAQRLMAKAGEVVITRDAARARELERDDDAMDRLHRRVFRRLLDARWEHGIETAVDVTLLGRYYERFADHAVSVADRVVYLVTGEHAEAER